MEEQKRAVLKEKIREKIEETENRIKTLEVETQPIAPENSIGRISRMDAINNKSVSEAALRQAQKILGKLKIALREVDKSGFGICELCKRPIPEGRLMFMPESSTCVQCADRR